MAQGESSLLRVETCSMRYYSRARQFNVERSLNIPTCCVWSQVVSRKNTNVKLHVRNRRTGTAPCSNVRSKVAKLAGAIVFVKSSDLRVKEESRSRHQTAGWCRSRGPAHVRDERVGMGRPRQPRTFRSLDSLKFDRWSILSPVHWSGDLAPGLAICARRRKRPRLLTRTSRPRNHRTRLLPTFRLRPLSRQHLLPSSARRMLATLTTTANDLAPQATWSLPVKGDNGGKRLDHADAASADLLTPPLTRPPSPSPGRGQGQTTPAERYAPPSTTLLNPRDYPRHQLTPAIGLRFEPEFQIKDILNLPEGDAKREALLKELAYTSTYSGSATCSPLRLTTRREPGSVSLHGVCAFPAQDLSADDLLVLAAALGRASGAPADSDLHIHPTAELGENGRPTVAAISNVAGAMGRQINFRDERSEFASMNAHADISWERRPARYSMLRMHTLPPTGVSTHCPFRVSLCAKTRIVYQ